MVRTSRFRNHAREIERKREEDTEAETEGNIPFSPLKLQEEKNMHIQL
jgi:hypothetical protein